jgi:hypothetical protein
MVSEAHTRRAALWKVVDDIRYRCKAVDATFSKEPGALSATFFHLSISFTADAQKRSTATPAVCERFGDV